MMKERFAKLLLGEDMSGSGKGVCTALAISNAITNLCGTCVTKTTCWLALHSLVRCRLAGCSPVALHGFNFLDDNCSFDLLLMPLCAPCLHYSDDIRPDLEAGDDDAGEEGHVAPGDGLAALCQRPHHRARAHVADVPGWYKA